MFKKPSKLVCCLCFFVCIFHYVRLNDESRRLFEELGSTAVKDLAFRDSWVFVGAKGIENKSPFEQVCSFLLLVLIEGWRWSLCAVFDVTPMFS